MSVRSSRQSACRVPWHVDRSAPPLYRFVNTSPHVLRGVSVSVSGRARLQVSGPAAVHPGEAVAATVTGKDLERDAIVIVRWLQPDGLEYLWQVSF